MSLIRGMLDALRGGAREVGESIVDSQALRIFEQQIVDAENAIAKARQSLTGIKATQIRLQRDVDQFNTEINGYENKAIQLLNDGNEALAGEVAEKLATLEAGLNEKQAELDLTSNQINELYQLIKSQNGDIETSKRELERIKTVDQVQKATRAISSNLAAGSSATNRLNKSKERIKAKHQRFKDTLAAGDAMAAMDAGSDLDAKIAAAGAGSADDKRSAILQRLKNKAQQ